MECQRYLQGSGLVACSALVSFASATSSLKMFRKHVCRADKKVHLTRIPDLTAAGFWRLEKHLCSFPGGFDSECPTCFLGYGPGILQHRCDVRIVVGGIVMK